MPSTKCSCTACRLRDPNIRVASDSVFRFFAFVPDRSLRLPCRLSAIVNRIAGKSCKAPVHLARGKRPRSCNAVVRPVTSGQRESGTGGGFTANRGKRVPGSGAGPGSRSLVSRPPQATCRRYVGRTFRSAFRLYRLNRCSTSRLCDSCRADLQVRLTGVRRQLANQHQRLVDLKVRPTNRSP
jgi:hypothetical protein